MEPLRCARLQPRSGGRGGLRQGDCMTKDRSGRLTGHIGHKGYSNPSGRKHAHILKVWEVRSKKLGHSLQNCLIKLQSVNFISYIMEATEDFGSVECNLKNTPKTKTMTVMTTAGNSDQNV